MAYANIIVDISHEAVDRPFTYIIPDRLLDACHPGTRVMIPFGQGNRLKLGIILEITSNPDVPIGKLKEIESVVLSQDATDSRLIELAFFIKQQYGSKMIDALKTVLPAKKAYREKASATDLSSYEGFNDDSDGLSEGRIIPSDKQQAIIDDICADYDKGAAGTYLIHGITGSGKTLIYTELIKHVVDSGRQAIMLIPEIGLTYQTVSRFKKYFGDRVAIMNSTLAAGARYRYYEQARNGDIDVIIGPRSALFMPFEKLGIIVMDEEHEGAYKSENSPRYHAREVALELASMHGASVVLGSATPSVESYYHALKGDYKLYKLTDRAMGASLPHTDIVDMREELRSGNRSIFSGRLRTLLTTTVAENKQAMLFINRRGYAGFVSCRACGEVLKCPHCDVSLKEHRSRGMLVCHYCGYETAKPKTCPSCGSKYIMSFKAGTEQIEEEVKKLIPGVRTLRMDGDTTAKKGSFDKIVRSFGCHEADVLIGTQMIVKGHDFPDVTLVGILAADIGLSGGDYRSGERTFELITQAAGRAGRGDDPGQVVIQTYQPDNYSIVRAAAQDYEAFYNEEILYREISGYPPIMNIMAVMASGKDADETYMYVNSLVSVCRAAGLDAGIIGPGKAGIGKINDNHRYVFYVKSTDKDVLIKLKDAMEEHIDKDKGTGVSGRVLVTFDFNPMNPF